MENKERLGSSGIGGQAVIEGIMMRNKDKYAVAVRKPDKSIDVDIQECGGIAKKYKITTLPFIRGIFSFIDSMVIGIKTLTYSASFFEDEDEQEEEPGKFEKWLLNKFGEKAEKVVMGFTVCLSIVIAVALFMILPLFIADVIEKYVPGDIGSESVAADKDVAVIDVGTKKNIIRCLLNRGCNVTVYPCDFDADEVIASKPDGIMITNGPGDPAECVDIIAQVKKLADSNIPVFAICLGHQLMALAHNAKTYKMKYGHRGANHPVKNLETGKVYISSQNHGYVVDADGIDASVAKPWFVNVNDGTIEGLEYIGKPVKTVQFHPEANAGPKDSEMLFDEFMKMIGGNK